MTAVKACKTIEVSPQTMWRMEAGATVKLRDIYVDALCRLYRASEDETAALVGLVSETKSTGWWHAYGEAIPAHFDLYLGLEEAARKLTTYQLTLLPGMLQTPDYRRAMIWVEFPSAPSGEVEQRVELAMRRQQRLNESVERFSMEVLLSEAVLHHQVGGPAVMGRQLEHLVEISRLPNVSIRIVPQNIGAHIGLQTGPFVLLEFPTHSKPEFSEPPVVYVEGYTGALYLDRESEIVRYRSAIAEIRRRALDERSSRELMVKMAREYTE